ncbi:MAG TPA: isoprenylcysteine carboxylmethyltransferase family protein [Candidatus Hydrogenedentes bacterium]|nr:isoprenylcysteine carboxylmethyltransferase family protein [Candidatus Hydrogenedentota bacterium]
MDPVAIEQVSTLLCLLVLPVGWLEYRILEKSRWGVLLSVINLALLYGPWVVLGWRSFTGLAFSPNVLVGSGMMVVAIVLFLTGVPSILKARGQITTWPDSLVTTGPYRFIRHPLYAGHALLIVGGMLAAAPTQLFMATPVLWIIAIIASRYEETHRLQIRFGEAYTHYSARTPFLLPVWGWILYGIIYLTSALKVL